MDGEAARSRATLLSSEDGWAVWFGFALFAVGLLGLVEGVPKPGAWSDNPLEGLPLRQGAGVAALFVGLASMTAIGVRAMGRDALRYAAGLGVVFAMAFGAKLLGKQEGMNDLGLGYALWSLLFGLAVANTVGTPAWVLEGARSEMFIKTGLVLLGAEILFHRIVALGGPGLVVAWAVTPAVVFFMWKLGSRVLKLESKALTMVIACATSVCGVSAAIASAAAVRAKKEELTLAVGMTMIFTVVMMIGMPALAKVLGLSDAVAGAWIGGTVDSTGAVVAAGSLFSESAGHVAAVIKMIQNGLIGIIAFVIAAYWVSSVEPSGEAERPSPSEMWRRFPKFVVGFVAASLVFSFVLIPALGEPPVEGIVEDVTKPLRGWFFALAFVAIGLESNFKQLSKHLVGGKPIALYAAGQTFNILLTLLVAYLAFGGIGGELFGF
ncbi:MAG: YeiH family protein [Myxococcota bacterium]